MEWRFTLIDYLLNRTVVDEPIGWSSIGKTLQRDPDWHGIYFQFTQNTLEFADEGYWIIKQEYKRMRVDGDMGLLIEWKCDDCEDCGFRIFYDCKLDFAQYDEFCGDYCSIKIGLNNSTAETLLKNRQDTNVDLTSSIANDGVTMLTDYPSLGIDIEVPGKALMIRSEGRNNGDNVSDNLVASEWTIGGVLEFYGTLFFGFNNILYQDIPDTTFFDTTQHLAEGIRFGATPWIEFKPFNSGLQCTGSNGVLNYRIHATIDQEGAGNIATTGTIDVAVMLAGVDPNQAAALQVLNEQPGWFKAGPGTIEFDVSLSGLSVNLKEGDKLFVVGAFSKIQQDHFTSFVVTVHEDSFLQYSLTSICDPSQAKAFLIHEAASRVVESITNNQLKFKSDYFGRTDSLPYPALADGCGGLRALTNGLQLRRLSLGDGTSPKVFTSFKDLFTSTNATDAVGIGLEPPDPVVDSIGVKGHVRMEPLRYFYSPEIVLYCDGIDKVNRKTMNERIWNGFNFGYDKYETESTNGLDAIHTKRQYRTPVINSSTPLEKICKYIADGYAIEATRRKIGTTEDWRYDQNIFLLCLVRSAPYSVEQGNISAGANLFDPPTVFNYRITPIRNAMRWYNWLMQGVKATRQMIFNSGDGNYVAEGQLSDTSCREENAIVAENETITDLSFQNPDTDAVPWIEPEEITFTFPLGANEYIDLLRSSQLTGFPKRYGLIAWRRFENEAWEYGWINSIKYTPEDGTADFSLISAAPAETAIIVNLCNGVSATITSVISNGGSGIIITGTAYTGTMNDVYASETGLDGSYVLISPNHTSAELIAGITIDPIGSYKFFEIHSYDTAEICDYGYSLPYHYVCAPAPAITFTDNADGTITLHVTSVASGETIKAYGSIIETGPYTEIGSIVATGTSADITVDATAYAWFKVTSEDSSCDYGESNIINFVYNPCVAGFNPTIDSVTEDGFNIIITGTAVPLSTIQVFGSTEENGTFAQVGDLYTAEELAAGITLTSAQYGLDTWFRVHSYNATCDYGFNLNASTGDDVSVTTDFINPVFFDTTDEVVTIYKTAALVARFGNIPIFQLYLYDEQGQPQLTSGWNLAPDVQPPNTSRWDYLNAGGSGYILMQGATDREGYPTGTSTGGGTGGSGSGGGIGSGDGGSGASSTSFKTMSWTIEGVQRTAVVWQPDGLTGLPILFAWHGHGGTGTGFSTKHFENYFDLDSIIVVYPNGLLTPSPADGTGTKTGWQHSVGEVDLHTSVTDKDLKFYDAMLLTFGPSIDASKILNHGWSNGGEFCYDCIWVARSTTVHALCCSSAILNTTSGKTPVPVMHTAGVTDPAVPFASQQSKFDDIKTLNGCSGSGSTYASGPNGVVATAYTCSQESIFLQYDNGHAYPDNVPAIIVQFFKDVI